LRICNRALLISSLFLLLTCFGNTSIALLFKWESFFLLTEWSLTGWMGCFPCPTGVHSLHPGVWVSEDGLYHVWRELPQLGHQYRHQQGRTWVPLQGMTYKGHALQARSCRRSVTRELNQVTRRKQEVYNLRV
jgi:hypothetical protein